MTVAEGIYKCETSPECAAFTYHGPKGDLNNKYNLFFFSIYKEKETINIVDDIDWTMYVVTSKMYVKLANTLFPSTSVVQSEGKMCIANSQCIGYSYSESKHQSKLLLQKIDFNERISDERWDTYLLIPKFQHVSFKKALSESSPKVSCCHPSNVTEQKVVNPIPRHKCNLSREEFEAKFIRTTTPVILENCTGYENWKHSKFTLDSLVRMYYDNTTKPRSTTPTPLPISFTHYSTPNDLKLSVDEALEYFASGQLRAFQPLRTNAKLDIFAQFPKPSVFPNDLYIGAKYETHLNWAILGQANTGSPLHVDPDFTGAWNYLIHGHKHWVIFPPGNFTNQFTI